VKQHVLVHSIKKPYFSYFKAINVKSPNGFGGRAYYWRNWRSGNILHNYDLIKIMQQRSMPLMKILKTKISQLIRKIQIYKYPIPTILFRIKLIL
jgi:hypothetical protein